MVEEYGKIDCLINDAGLWIQGEISDNDQSRIQQVVDVNLTGLIFATKAVAPSMKENKKGLIININSQAGFYAKTERSVYTATKWGVTGFTKSIQPELAKYNIRVTDVHPGKMKTSLFEKVGIKKDFKNALNPPKVARVIRFILETDEDVVFPEIGIKNIQN